jgi:RNA polymerase sigma-70 factor, ECF subfamily
LSLLPREHRFDGMHKDPIVDKQRHRFDEIVLPHLDAAYHLARWLVRSDDAEDVAQEACLRAFRYFRTFRGGNPRAWLLSIVRTTAFSWLHRHRAQLLETEFNEEIHGEERDALDPEALLLQRAHSEWVEQAISQLPVRLREVLVLRELEGLSYKEIAEVVGVPIGTVMSTLFRARETFRRAAISQVGRRESGRDERQADIVEEDYANCS